MKKTNCFATLEILIDQASIQFDSACPINKNRLQKIKSFCTIFDKLLNIIDSISYEIEIDNISHVIIFRLECTDMIIEQNNHIFFDLIKNTKTFNFTLSNDNNLLLNFVYPSIWEESEVCYE